MKRCNVKRLIANEQMIYQFDDVLGGFKRLGLEICARLKRYYVLLVPHGPPLHRKGPRSHSHHACTNDIRGEWRWGLGNTSQSRSASRANDAPPRRPFTTSLACVCVGCKYFVPLPTFSPLLKHCVARLCYHRGASKLCILLCIVVLPAYQLSYSSLSGGINASQ